MSNSNSHYIALALSGGGARAMAFHLGCLRALQDRRILDKVKVISTVSGGSVIGAYWAYNTQEFEDFDREMVSVLKRGIQRDILYKVFFSSETLKILATLFITGSLTVILQIVTTLISTARNWFGIPTFKVEIFLTSLARMLPIWGNFTTAFEAALDKRLFKGRKLENVQKPNLSVIINACDLRTGTAFRFGSEKSGGWRYGSIVGNSPTVAKAVASSAAFPILLPPLVEDFEFEKKGQKYRATVSLTDGGVYDNLGVAAIEPGKGSESIYNHLVTHIISLNAGAGQLDGEDYYYWWKGRVSRSFTAVHRKAQDAMYQRLHKYLETGELAGFGLVYLGQQDQRLPYIVPDLVRREKVKNYPTDFSPMTVDNIELLTKRGEQLTHIIIDHYLQHLTQ
ncbi:hypothetical protein GCM10028807_60100 [Spirosoma daeguense]